MPLWLGYLVIFFARVADVSLGTIRMLMVMRGRRLQASVIGFFEVILFLLAISLVVRSLDEPLKVVMYGLGFATGSFLGSFIEERMAIGVLTAQIVPTRGRGHALAERLREQGFGVTIVTGEGREGLRKVLFVTLRRKMLHRLMKFLESDDPGAFVTVFEMQRTRGGVFAYRNKSK